MFANTRRPGLADGSATRLRNHTRADLASVFRMLELTSTGRIESHGNGHGWSACGIHVCDAHTIEFDSYPFTEYCCVLNGRVEITNPAGTVRLYRPGDWFILTKGSALTWRNVITVRKFYVEIDNREKRLLNLSDGQCVIDACHRFMSETR